MAAARALATPYNWGALPDIVLRRIAWYVWDREDPNDLGTLAMHFVCRHWHHSLGRVVKPPRWDFYATRLELFQHRAPRIVWAIESRWVAADDALEIALEYATRWTGFLELLRMLLNRNDVSIRTKTVKATYYDALRMAAGRNNVECLQLLVETNKRPRGPGACWLTPALNDAVKYAAHDAVRYLVMDAHIKVPPSIRDKVCRSLDRFIK